MRAIIYAAGVSRRLRPIAKNGLKGLLWLNTKRIVEHQLDWISMLPVSEVVIVIGLEHEEYKAILGDTYRGVKITYVYNKNYKTKGNMLSLWCARDYCDTDIVFTTSDLVCDPRNVALFVRATQKTKILIDSKSTSLFSDDDPVKAYIEGGRICRLRKKADQLQRVDGIAIGIYQFCKDDISKVLERIEGNIASGIDDLSLYYAIDGMLSDAYVAPVYAENGNWCDVDTPDEYIHARSRSLHWFGEYDKRT